MVEDAHLSKHFRGHMHGKLIISTVNVNVQVSINQSRVPYPSGTLETMDRH